MIYDNCSGCFWALTFFWIQILGKEDSPINKDQLINDEIVLPKVRLVGENGEQIGIVSSAEANKIADERELDLVLISPQADPPVCKIMNYGKFMFDKAKREKEARKNQKVIELKEVQLSMTIDTHDMQVKAKHAKRFLEEGNKVKVTIKMRGRQQARPEAGIAVMATFVDMLEGLASIEKNAEILGRNIIMILAPNKK